MDEFDFQVFKLAHGHKQKGYICGKFDEMPALFIVKDTAYSIEEIMAAIEADDLVLQLDPKLAKKIKANRAYLEQKMSQKDAVFYGINTGFGSLCNIKISHGELSTLQFNLVRSHACGTGALVDPLLCKLIFLLKIINLSKAYSGVRKELIVHMIHLFNAGLVPVIYEQGSLGASGDLAPLAHLSLMLIGEGKCYYKGKMQDTARVFKNLQLQATNLASKEGLALLNGTQFTLAHAMTGVFKAQKAMLYGNRLAAMSLEAFGCSTDPFHPLVGKIRNHRGQAAVAAEILGLVKGSKLTGHKKYSVQDPYSFRCIPQVHGASYTAIEHVSGVVENELNAVTDNPNIGHEEDLILSAGNFHAQNLGLVVDYLAIALAELGNIAERRIFQLIHGERGLPPYLTADAGLSSGFMIAQYTAASVVSQNKQLCSPSSVDSIVSSRGQEDHVSMAANGATRLLKICENVNTVYAIEALIACQALDFRGPENAGKKSREMYGLIRKSIPYLSTDRVLHDDIFKAKDILKALK